MSSRNSDNIALFLAAKYGEVEILNRLREMGVSLLFTAATPDGVKNAAENAVESDHSFLEVAAAYGHVNIFNWAFCQRKGAVISDPVDDLIYDPVGTEAVYAVRGTTAMRQSQNVGIMGEPKLPMLTWLFTNETPLKQSGETIEHTFRNGSWNYLLGPEAIYNDSLEGLNALYTLGVDGIFDDITSLTRANLQALIDRWSRMPISERGKNDRNASPVTEWTSLEKKILSCKTEENDGDENDVVVKSFTKQLKIMEWLIFHGYWVYTSEHEISMLAKSTLGLTIASLAPSTLVKLFEQIEARQSRPCNVYGCRNRAHTTPTYPVINYPLPSSQVAQNSENRDANNGKNDSLLHLYLCEDHKVDYEEGRISEAFNGRVCSFSPEIMSAMTEKRWAEQEYRDAVKLVKGMRERAVEEKQARKRQRGELRTEMTDAITEFNESKDWLIDASNRYKKLCRQNQVDPEASYARLQKRLNICEK